MVSGAGNVERLVMSSGDNPDGLSKKFWADDAAIVIALGCEVMEMSDYRDRAEVQGHCCYGAAMEVVWHWHIDL